MPWRLPEITEFIKISDIDPLYYESSFYTVPEDPGRKWECTRREYIVVIRPRDKTQPPRLCGDPPPQRAAARTLLSASPKLPLHFTFSRRPNAVVRIVR